MCPKAFHGKYSKFSNFSNTTIIPYAIFINMMINFDRLICNLKHFMLLIISLTSNSKSLPHCFTFDMINRFPRHSFSFKVVFTDFLFLVSTFSKIYDFHYHCCYFDHSTTYSLCLIRGFVHTQVLSLASSKTFQKPTTRSSSLVFLNSLTW